MKTSVFVTVEYPDFITPQDVEGGLKLHLEKTLTQALDIEVQLVPEDLAQWLEKELS